MPTKLNLECDICQGLLERSKLNIDSIEYENSNVFDKKLEFQGDQQFCYYKNQLDNVTDNTEGVGSDWSGLNKGFNGKLITEDGLRFGEACYLQTDKDSGRKKSDIPCKSKKIYYKELCPPNERSKCHNLKEESCNKSDTCEWNSDEQKCLDEILTSAEPKDNSVTCGFVELRNRIEGKGIFNCHDISGESSCNIAKPNCSSLDEETQCNLHKSNCEWVDRAGSLDCNGMSKKKCSRNSSKCKWNGEKCLPDNCQFVDKCTGLSPIDCGNQDQCSMKNSKCTLNPICSYHNHSGKCLTRPDPKYQYCKISYSEIDFTDYDNRVNWWFKDCGTVHNGECDSLTESECENEVRKNTCKWDKFDSYLKSKIENDILGPRILGKCVSLNCEKIKNSNNEEVCKFNHKKFDFEDGSYLIDSKCEAKENIDCKTLGSNESTCNNLTFLNKPNVCKWENDTCNIDCTKKLTSRDCMKCLNSNHENVCDWDETCSNISK